MLKRSRLGQWRLLSILALGGVSCADTETDVDHGDLVLVDVYPYNATVERGLKRQYAAMGVYEDGTSVPLFGKEGLAWESSNTAVATVNASGLVTAVAVGVSEITATYEGLTDTTDISVTPQLADVELNPPFARANVGFGTTFRAIAIYEDNTSADVSGDASFAVGDTTVASVSANVVTGLVGAAGGEVSTPVTVAYRGLVREGTLTVLRDATVTGIEIYMGPDVVPMGFRAVYGARATVTSGTSATPDIGPVWSVDDKNIATIDGGGVLRTKAAGTVVITAKYKQTPTATEGVATKTVTVQEWTLDTIVTNPAPLAGETAATLSLVPEMTASLAVNGNFTVDGAAQVFPITRDLSFASANREVASAWSDRVVRGEAPGTTVVTAAFGTEGTPAYRSTTWNVVVSGEALQSITISGATTVAIGATTRLDAAGPYGVEASPIRVRDRATWRVTPQAGSPAGGLLVNNSTSTVRGTMYGIAAGTYDVRAYLEGKVSSAHTVTVTPPP